MILKSFFELKLDLLILRNQLLLPGEDHTTLGALLFQLMQVRCFCTLFYLLIKPLGLASIDPFR